MAFQNTGQRQLQEMQERARKQQEDQRRRMEMAHWKRLKDEEARLRAERLRSGSGAVAGPSASSRTSRGGTGLPGTASRAGGSPLSSWPVGRAYERRPQGHPILALLLLPILLVVVALVGIAIGWFVEYGINFGNTASVIAAVAFWTLGGLWALWRTISTWRGD